MNCLPELIRLFNLTNFEELKNTEKSILISIAMSALYLFLILLYFIVVGFHFAIASSDTKFTSMFLYVCCATIAVMLALLILSLKLKTKTPDSSTPLLIHIYFIGQPLMALAVLNGVPLLITGLLLAIMPLTGAVYIQNKHVIYATLMIWAETIILGICVSLGILPNAPLYSSSMTAQGYSTSWFLVQIFIGIPIMAITLLGCYHTINGMQKSRETILTLSRRDGLTNLWNRRYLTEIIERELAVAQRTTTNLSLIMIDLDHFKALNDTHGHIAGDQAIISAAHIIASRLRKTDYVGRFGGEEFLAVLPACSPDHAQEIAEDCRRLIENSFIDYLGKHVVVTASFGVTTTHPESIIENVDLFIDVVDKALYQAKQSGRNCVVFRSYI